MAKFEITLLGCGSALPTQRHMTSAQLVNVDDRLFLVDCGEGTQTAIAGFTKERLPIAFSMKYCSIFSVAS